jgi:uncharacterized membrane protein YgcG
MNRRAALLGISALALSQLQTPAVPTYATGASFKIKDILDKLRAKPNAHLRDVCDELASEGKSQVVTMMVPPIYGKTRRQG